MPEIRVTIERFTDVSQPGWVECTLVDADGLTHVFEEKVPIVSAEVLDVHSVHSVYPREGSIACTIISARRGADGRELVMVDTELPWGIESKTGEVRFEILREQLLDEGAG